MSGSEIIPVDLIADSSAIWVLADVKNTVFKADGSKILPYGKSATLKEEITERAFKLYPTVTSDFIYWEPSSLWDNKKAVVTVFDASGRAILQQAHEQVIPQSYRIDLSAESEGTYLIDISGADFKEVTKAHS